MHSNVYYWPGKTNNCCYGIAMLLHSLRPQLCLIPSALLYHDDPRTTELQSPQGETQTCEKVECGLI